MKTKPRTSILNLFTAKFKKGNKKAYPFDRVSHVGVDQGLEIWIKCIHQHNYIRWICYQKRNLETSILKRKTGRLGCKTSSRHQCSMINLSIFRVGQGFVKSFITAGIAIVATTPTMIKFECVMNSLIRWMYRQIRICYTFIDRMNVWSNLNMLWIHWSDECLPWMPEYQHRRGKRKHRWPNLSVLLKYSHRFQLPNSTIE